MVGVDLTMRLTGRMDMAALKVGTAYLDIEGRVVQIAPCMGGLRRPTAEAVGRARFIPPLYRRMRRSRADRTRRSRPPRFSVITARPVLAVSRPAPRME